MDHPEQSRAVSDEGSAGALPPWEESTRSETSEASEVGRSRWSRVAPPLLSLVVVAALALGITMVVRGGTHQNDVSSATSHATSTHNTSAAQPTAPDFTLATLNGSAFHLASQRGHVVVLYFMSTTCTECVHGSYLVASAMQEVTSPGVQAIAIDMNSGDTPSDVIAFQQSASIPKDARLTWAFDTNQHVASRYGVLALGTVFVVDPQGHIVYESDGSVVLGQLVPIIQRYA